MNIYEQALGKITEKNWIKEQMFDNNGNRCLAGHLIYAQYGQDKSWFELPDLNTEDFVLVLHKIIAAQYPETVDAWLAGEENLLSWIGLVTFFNDYHASYDDIRTVLGKAAADERT